MTVTLVIEGENAEYLADAIDLSSHGLCLQSGPPLPKASRGPPAPPEPPCVIKARVVWVGKADSAQIGQVGFEFLNPLPGPVC